MTELDDIKNEPATLWVTGSLRHYAIR